MSINLVQSRTSRPDEWIRQSSGKINGGLQWINQQRNRTVVTGNYTLTDSDVYLGCDGGHTITLAGALSGRRVTIKDEAGTAGASAITVTGTVDGAANPTISTNYGVIRLISNGTNWFTI